MSDTNQEDPLLEFMELCRSDPDRGRALLEQFLKDKPESANEPMVIYAMARAYLYKVLHTISERVDGKGSSLLKDDELVVLEMALKMMKKIEHIQPGFLKSIGTDEEGVGEGELDNIGMILERQRPGRFQEIFGKTKLRFFSSDRVGIATSDDYLGSSLQKAIKRPFFECEGIVKTVLILRNFRNDRGRWVECVLYADSLEERNENLGTVYICEDGTVSKDRVVKKEPDDQKEEKSGCFIATAVYGSPLASEVVLLRNFRDAVLEKYCIGRGFISAYYALSPALACAIKKSQHTQSIIRRFVLNPLVRLISRRFSH